MRTTGEQIKYAYVMTPVAQMKPTARGSFQTLSRYKYDHKRAKAGNEHHYS